MPLWEYKHITSGPHGFATPALLEAHLNQLGKDEWEIIHYQTLPANALAFNGVARRPTTREWTLEDAAAAAAKAEADKLRAEFAAKFQAASAPAAAEDTKPAVLDTEATGGDGLRRLRDTERDDDPEALADEAAGDDWANLGESEDELPSFFDAIKPHLRRNQRGPGQSVAIDYLAKRWEQPEADLVGALKECGFALPETEDTPPEYIEFDGDLHWLNRNQRGQLFLNVREKPRPAFRITPAKKLDPADPAAIALAEEHAAEQAVRQKIADERAARQAEQDARRAEASARREAARGNEPPPADGAAPSAIFSPTGQASSGPADPANHVPLPAGEELLAKIRPLMRPNRRGPGWSGSTTFLARALRCTEADLVAALAALGLVASENSNDKPVPTEIGEHAYWLNRDSRGGIWINGHERRDGGPAAGQGSNPKSQTANGAVSGGASSAPSQNSLAAVRLLLKPNKRGSGVSGEVGFLARTLERPEADFLATLAAAGVPRPSADPEAKPVFTEHDGEIFWLNQNAKDGSLWLNAKAAKKSAGRRPSKKT